MMDPSEPKIEFVLTHEELAIAAGIRPTLLARLIRLGVVEPDRPDTGQFTVSTLARVRRMLRLHTQLGVNFTGAAVILDLLDRIERLEGAPASRAVDARLDPERLPPPEASR